MRSAGSAEFAYARIHARHGARPTEVDWRRIESMREFSGVLHAAGECGLRPWVAGIAATSPVHEVEFALRANWRVAVREASSWLEPAWQPAADWCCALADLASLEHLASGAPAPAWMLADDVLRDACAAPSAERARAVAAGAFAPLARDWGEPGAITRQWIAEWRRRVPAAALRPGSALDALARALRAHLVAFGTTTAGDGNALRRALSARLRLIARRVQVDPALAFVHVALNAIELERLRGEMVRRIAFAAPAGA